MAESASLADLCFDDDSDENAFDGFEDGVDGEVFDPDTPITYPMEGEAVLMLGKVRMH